MLGSININIFVFWNSKAVKIELGAENDILEFVEQWCHEDLSVLLDYFRLLDAGG